MIDQLRAASEALSRGDPEPFVALIAEDSEWRGLSTGFPWNKATPACHGPAEAREVLKFALQQRRGLPVVLEPQFAQAAEDKV